MVKQEDRMHFLAWLKRNTKLSPRVISDVVSRLARIEKITPLHTNVADDEFLFKLGKKEGFSELTPSVKSQLKNAYKLFYLFRNSK